MAKPGKLYYGFHYINKYNIQEILRFIEKLKRETGMGHIEECHFDEWNEDIDIIRYTVIGEKNYRETVCIVFGAIQMLLQLHTGKTIKGE